MPAFWMACFFGLVFVLIETRHPSGSVLLAEHASGSGAEIALRFAGLSGIYPREIFGGNYPLVTVAVEIVMYALYPWFHWHASRGHWLGLGLGFGLLQIVAVMLLRIATPYWVFNSVLMLGLFWYIGAFAAHLYVTRGTTIRARWFLLAWAGYLAFKTVPHFYGLNILRQDAWALVCAAGLLCALRGEATHPAAREHRWVRAMRYSGRISYSVYAMHTPAIMLATWTLIVVVKNEDYFFQLATTGLSAVAAILFTYYCIERVFYRPRVN